MKAMKTVSSKDVKDDGRSNRLTGYFIVEEDSIGDAVEMTKICRISITAPLLLGK